MFLPRFAAFSIEARTFLTNASTSSERSGAGGSCITLSVARRYSPLSSTVSRWARVKPCTRMRVRPSGSFNMRMMTATVPTR